MKALKIHGARDMRVEDIDLPVPGEGEVRVRMQFGGICGSDLHYYFNGKNGSLRDTSTNWTGHFHVEHSTLQFEPLGHAEDSSPIAPTILDLPARPVKMPL